MEIAHFFCEMFTSALLQRERVLWEEIKRVLIPYVRIKEKGARSWEHRWRSPFIASRLCDIGFKGTVVSERHRLEHEDPCPNYVVCVCLGRPRWQAGNGEGGPSGQEAVKESSGYKDQTAGRTALKATAATVLKVWVTLLDTRDTHTHILVYMLPKGYCAGVCVYACACVSVSILINTQQQMCTHEYMHVHSVTHTLTRPTLPPL